jgi:hypothetical protein
MVLVPNCQSIVFLASTFTRFSGVAAQAVIGGRVLRPKRHSVLPETPEPAEAYPTTGS